MNFFIKLFSNLFGDLKNDDWAVRYMAIEYQKDFSNLKKTGVSINPEVAMAFLSSAGDQNVK